MITLVVEIDMVHISGGTFMMGSTSSEAYSNEQPVYQVALSSFYIAKYEVTQGQWRTVMGNNPSRFLKGDNYPVEQVSWLDVQTFITKLNQLTGKRYRLPTEAEWEYAARAGTNTDRYGKIDEIAWYDKNSGGFFRKGTHPVGMKKPNEYGLYDMLGNVWEWVQDWDGPLTSGEKFNPQGPLSGSDRLNRGGSWIDDARNVRASRRYYNTPGSYCSALGFRLAMDGGK
jgi:formylglycine-generating enzyme required for sulfatase activity